MKKLFFLLAAFTAGQLHAQPVIQSSNYYTPGTVLNFETTNITNVQPGPSGANQTWNFSSLSLSGESYTYRYLTAAATPYSSMFPASNIGIEIIDNLNADTSYMYQTKTNLIATYDGNATSDNGNVISFINSNPQTILEFPVSFNTTANDYLAGSMTISGGGMSMVTHRYGPQTMVADGYGTLQLPGATFNNCLRLKYRQVLTDSTLFTGMPFPATISTDIKTMYTWVQIVNGMAVERLTMTYDTISDDNGTQYETYCQFNRSTTTGLTDASTGRTAMFSLYPNPAHEQLTITFNENREDTFGFELMDATGKILEQRSVVSTGAPEQNILNIQHLPPGMYLIRLSTSNGSYTEKFLHF